QVRTGEVLKRCLPPPDPPGQSQKPIGTDATRQIIVNRIGKQRSQRKYQSCDQDFLRRGNTSTRHDPRTERDKQSCPSSPTLTEYQEDHRPKKPRRVRGTSIATDISPTMDK